MLVEEPLSAYGMWNRVLYAVKFLREFRISELTRQWREWHSLSWLPGTTWT